MTGEFVVEIKKSARARNSAVNALYDRRGEHVTYPSEAHAREAVKDLSDRGAGPVRLQATAPQDGSSIDAYLVGASRHDIDIPDRPPEDGWTFGVDASQYGALGEALLTPAGRAARPLTTFVRYDHDLEPDAAVNLAVERNPDPIAVPGRDRRWEPDCLLEARVNHRLVGRYACEVKTGDGRLERSQEAAIDAAARELPVLVVFVDVSSLPATYDVRIEKVDHRGPGRTHEQLTLDEIR